MHKLQNIKYATQIDGLAIQGRLGYLDQQHTLPERLMWDAGGGVNNTGTPRQMTATAYDPKPLIRHLGLLINNTGMRRLITANACGP